MRVVHLSCVAPPQIGGIGSVALREVTLLRARGVQAELIVPSIKFGDTTPPRSFMTRVEPYWRVGNAAALPHIGRLVEGADVIHIHYPFYGTAEPLLWRELSVPVVMTFHMDAFASGLKGLAFAFHRRLIQPSLFSQVTQMLVSSFDYARHSSLQPWFTAHPERVTEIPFGVDLDFFSPGPVVRHRFQVPMDAPTLLFVGGLDQAHAFKGIQELLSAFRELNASSHLLIIGDGDLKSSYERQAQAWGIGGRVHFLGRVDDEAVRDAYRSSDVFVLPSTNVAEAFSLVALEAEACGTPVVASDLPGVRTVVRHGKTGLLVPPKNHAALVTALEQLVSNHDLRQTFGQEARRFVEQNFSWDKHVDQLMEVYQRVCALRF